MAASQMSLLLLALLALTASTSAEPTIHEVLQEFGFPPGLVPDSVESYSLQLAPGFRTVLFIKLKSPCHVKYGPHDVYFDSEITAFISIYSITNLLGVQAKWTTTRLTVFSIIKANEDSTFLQIDLNPGFLLYLDIKLFESIPTCEDEALAAAAGNASSKLISQLPVTAA